MPENRKFITVIFVQTILGADPDKPPVILHDRLNPIRPSSLVRLSKRRCFSSGKRNPVGEKMNKIANRKNLTGIFFELM
jgi:hypothetical protein